MSLLCETPRPSRRAVLMTGGALFAWAYLPRFARAADNRDPRLIVIVLRGALDGLSAVGPVGDPDYAGLHGDIALSLTGPHAALPLDGFFAVNPAMPVFARLFKARQAAVVHAAATGYRERSHFDGQDVLESGYAGPGHVATGWLNRALESLPAGDRVATLGGLAVGPSTPLVIRGAAPVLGWAPQSLPPPAGDLAARVLDLYQHRDPVLAVALQKGLDADRMALDDQMVAKAIKPKGGLDSAAGMRQAAQGAAKLIAADDGPRVAALAFDGWDTHVNEGGATGRLATLLGGLDGAFEEFEKGLGERWKDTAIVAITEFGRTARINGTVGTDHGTGTVVLLAGGAIKGDRVIADWPGLKPAQLREQRDLAPTSDVRAVLKGLLADQFGLSAAVLGDKVFPESAAVKPMTNLVV
ncbi:DUF1501 domain-containing protein [Mesorhizobium sp. B2-4-15]|uniref:DUF1501 domain-containing protein n=1 Tax=Mesorhizobium sp. B2-4-15 TaxID=2589934 RepID=UPI001154B227|nr:DUF1501 domain-containing protein [Mesorhizobium sp. B2-4-15]TPK70012.1 DUF1501 domain-containing protein [Mesorhizobium sp. B2-4-15]